MLNDFKNPLLHLEIHKMNKRHLVDEKGRHLIDFSTQGYLGFEQDKDVLNAQIEGLKFYGNVVPWSRTVATFGIYTRAENVLAKLVGSPAANMFLSTTLLNHGVIQALAGKKGAVIAFEQSAHKSLYEGAMLAKAKGAKVFGWKTLKDLEKILEKDACYKLVITDGVHSMSGSFAPLKELWALCERLDGYLYIDDAHGFGVVGENPSNDSPLGHKGNGLVGYFDIPFGRVFYVGCFSKAYGLSGAFIACTKEQKNFLLEQATPHDLGFSGQAGAITGLLKALELNHQKGDVKRRQLLEYSLQVTKVLEKKGYELYTKTTSFPIVTVLFHHDAEFLAFCKRLYERGILATVEPYLLKKPSILHGIRLTLTASHTKKDIQDLLGVF